MISAPCGELHQKAYAPAMARIVDFLPSRFSRISISVDGCFARSEVRFIDGAESASPVLEDVSHGNTLCARLGGALCTLNEVLSTLSGQSLCRICSTCATLGFWVRGSGLFGRV